MKDEWPRKPLGELCSFLNGGTPSKSVEHYFKGDIPWITGADITGPVVCNARSYITEEAIRASATNRVPKGTVLLVTRTSVGKVAIAGQDLCFSQDITALTPEPSRLDVGYLVGFLKTQTEHMERQARGATIKGITRDVVTDIEIPLPPLAEQRRIAEVLDRAEALRAKRRAALAELDSLTQSLFLDIFGDPVTNPKGWPLQMLGNVTEMITGYPFRSEEYVTNEDSVRLCRGANVLPGRLDWSDLARWPMSKADGLEDFRLRAGDVIIAMDRPWISEGFKIASVQNTDCPSLLVQRVARLRGGKHLPNEFLFYLLKQPAFTRHCRPTETTIPHISPKDIRSFSFPLPPIALQQEFARRVGAVEKLKAAQRTALAEQDALFATLQHRAFRGEL